MYNHPNAPERSWTHPNAPERTRTQPTNYREPVLSRKTNLTDVLIEFDLILQFTSLHCKNVIYDSSVSIIKLIIMRSSNQNMKSRSGEHDRAFIIVTLLLY